LPVVTQLADEDKKLRVVFKEFPILSEDSVTAARAALAVYHINKDKYFDYHQALMHLQGKFDQVALEDAARKVGVDSTRLKLEMEKPEITAELDSNRALGDQLQIHGTPALILNDQIYPGAMSYEELKKLIAATRVAKTPDGRPKN
jgi:protein-disulfide isomerase